MLLVKSVAVTEVLGLDEEPIESDIISPFLCNVTLKLPSLLAPTFKFIIIKTLLSDLVGVMVSESTIFPYGPLLPGGTDSVYLPVITFCFT